MTLQGGRVFTLRIVYIAMTDRDVRRRGFPIIDGTGL